MNRKCVRYVHPVVGEVWLQPESRAAEMLREKKIKELDAHIVVEYKKCYGDLVPVLNR